MAETSKANEMEPKPSFDSIVTGGSESGKDLHMKNALVGVNEIQYLRNRQSPLFC